MSFTEEIHHTLNGMTKERILFFSWLCAVRTLPFIGINGCFDFWPKTRRRRFLYSLLHALDYAAATNATAYAADSAATEAAEAAEAAESTKATEVADAIATAIARGVAAVATHAAHAAAATYTNAAYAAAYAAEAIVADATTVAELTGDTRFGCLVLDDLRHIKAGDFESFDHNLALYTSQKNGDIWKNFIASLRDEGCGYWADLYSDIFNSGFRIDTEKLAYRLSIPKEIS